MKRIVYYSKMHMKRVYELLLFLLLLPVLSITPCWSQDVPGFRGINCRGTTPETVEVPVHLTVENIIWKTALNEGVSSPCIAGNRIFTTGFNAADSSLTTYCIDIANGEIIWEHQVFPDTLEDVHAVGSQAAATPYTDGKNVYSYFGSYGIICYNINGQVKWQKRLPIPETMYGSCGSPVIIEKKLILNRYSAGNPLILALNPESGELIWKSRLEAIPEYSEAQRSQATPVQWKDQIFIHRAMALSSLNIEDGMEKWKTVIASFGVGTPVVKDNMLYVNGFTNIGESRLYDRLPDFVTMVSDYDANGDTLIQFSEIPSNLAVFRRPEVNLPTDTVALWNQWVKRHDSSKDNALDKKEWNEMIDYWSKWYLTHGTIAVRLNENMNENPPEILWKEEEFIPEVPSVLLEGDKVYMVANGGIVTCMNKDTGQVIYRERLGAPGAYLASPLLAGNHIYFISYNGRITVVKPGTKLNVVNQLDLKEKTAASPVAAGNKLIVRTKKHLYAFGQ